MDAPPRKPPQSSKYQITVMTDNLCQHPNSTASRVAVKASIYRGASNKWLESMGHRKTVYFVNGESYESRLNSDFSNLIGDCTPLWSLVLLDSSKNYVAEILDPGDWDHLQLYEEASKSRLVVLYLRLCDPDKHLEDCFDFLRLDHPASKIKTWIKGCEGSTGPGMRSVSNTSQRSQCSTASTLVACGSSEIGEGDMLPSKPVSESIIAATTGAAQLSVSNNISQSSTAAAVVASSYSQVGEVPSQPVPESLVFTVHVKYAGKHIGGTVRPPVITLISELAYDSILKKTCESYPYQAFIGRAPTGAIKCVGFNLGEVFFSCKLTMAAAMKGASDKTTLDVLLVDGL